MNRKRLLTMIDIGLLGFALGVGATSTVMLGPLKLRPVAVASASQSSRPTPGSAATTTARPGYPTPRSRPSIAYDEATGKFVLFGGTTEPAYMSPRSFLDDTWTWDGASWSEEHPSTAPPGRVGAGMTYDPAHKVVLMWGGLTDHGQSADFWSWDGSSWTQIRPATAFPPAEQLGNFPSAWPAPILTYDSQRQRIVLIRNNGFGQSSPQGPDVWTWDGSAWAHPTVTNAPAIWGTGTYDPALGAVLFFGLTSSQAPETWTFDGAGWSIRPSVLAPSSQQDNPPPMAYFGPSRTAVLVGDTGELWSWSGSDWAKQAGSATLPKRMGYSVGVDTAHGIVLTFGGDGPLGAAGLGALNQAWTWDGNAWKPTP